MKTILINDAHHPHLEYFRNLSFTPKQHLEHNIFITEGIVTFKKLLQSTINIKLILTVPKYISILENYNERLKDCDIYVMPSKQAVKQVVGFSPNEPLYAIAEIPQFCGVEHLSDKVVILNGVSKAENVGAICRNALAFDINSVIIDHTSCFPYLRRVVRVSLGSIFFMNVALTNNLVQTIQLLKNNGYKVVAIEQHQKSIKLKECKSQDKMCFIFGNEISGIDEEIMLEADEIVEININSKAESLNVAACSAIVFWEMT